MPPSSDEAQHLFSFLLFFFSATGSFALSWNMLFLVLIVQRLIYNISGYVCTEQCAVQIPQNLCLPQELLSFLH